MKREGKDVRVLGLRVYEQCLLFKNKSQNVRPTEYCRANVNLSGNKAIPVVFNKGNGLHERDISNEIIPPIVQVQPY